MSAVTALRMAKLWLLTRRVTDGGTEEITFLQQLLGNIGRIDASDILGEP